jgi:lipopolysaccharide transport system permease protein
MHVKHMIANFKEGRLNFLSIYKHTSLIFSMARRDVVGRYNGSVLGLLWSMFTPLLMLAVYTFAFGYVFKSRWPGVSDNPSNFALTLFPALLVFNYFTECISRAPTLIVSNRSYVKKVVFPLEILPIIVSLSALFHFFVGFFVWCIVALVLTGGLHLTLLFIPLVVLPLFFFSLGCGWILASLGVYLRDVQQIVNILTSALLFLSPVFFALDAIPEKFRSLMLLNPITHFVVMSRSAMVFGALPSLTEWLLVVSGSLGVAYAGAWWFSLTRKGFADVL